MTRTDDELAALGRAFARKRAAFHAARDELRTVVQAEAVSGAAEAKLARLLQVDRMTIRSWLGKR
jgi:hypothetical protein